MIFRVFDKIDAVLAIAALDVAFAAASNRLAVSSIIDPVPFARVVFSFNVTGIGDVSHV